MDSRFEHGERLTISERVIVAPTIGRFRPHDDVEAGMEISTGDAVGEVHGPGTVVPVLSPFYGVLQGVLSLPGERLRQGQAVAWLRVP